MRKRTIPKLRRSCPDPVVSVIIPVLNERRKLASVIRHAFAVHPRTEVIVVVNGSVDGSKETAERLGAKVVFYSRPLGHDVGRSIGAREAKGNILLFMDSDMIIPARELAPYIRAVMNGVDVALNTYSGPTKRKDVHAVVTVKHALNAIVGRTDLKGASLTTVPHAISRKALDTIGAEHLAVPPVAHAVAIHKGLKVDAVHLVNVIKLNPARKKERVHDPIGNLIVGDHLEALRWITSVTGARAGKTDLGRHRQLVK